MNFDDIVDKLFHLGMVVVMWAIALLALITFVMFCKNCFGAELVADSTGTFHFVPSQSESIVIVGDEPIEIEVNDTYDVYKDYRSDELREQQKDIDEYWEDGYRDYLRGWGVDENLMRGW